MYWQTVVHEKELYLDEMRWMVNMLIWIVLTVLHFTSSNIKVWSKAFIASLIFNVKSILFGATFKNFFFLNRKHFTDCAFYSHCYAVKPFFPAKLYGNSAIAFKCCPSFFCVVESFSFSLEVKLRRKVDKKFFFTNMKSEIILSIWTASHFLVF